MKKKMMLAACLAAMVMTFCRPAGAQVLIDSWTYAGGGLDPASYGGSYQPALLNPDTSSDNGASISVSGYAATLGGGLGSSSAGDYTYFYTLFSSAVNFSLETSNVLSGVQTITLSFWSGGTTAWSSSFLTLDFNDTNTAVAASGYSTTPGEDSEFGPVTYYTWEWDVSSLGASDGFSIDMVLGQHTPMGDIYLTQAIPEPSTWLLLGLGAGTLVGLRRLRHRGRRAAA